MATESDVTPSYPIVFTSDRSYNYEIDREEVKVVQDKYAQKFVEREQYISDKFEYPRTGNDPGLVLIFNQDEFKYYKPRRGSIRDVNEIVICLQRQGFNIEEEYILNNGTRDQIIAKLKKVSEMDLSQRNCLIIFFLTHGDELNILHTFDDTIKSNEIWSYFSHCESLQNKPKMFVFQACKGESFSTTTTLNSMPLQNSLPSNSNSLVPYNTFSSKFMGPDMLVVYSTIEGNVSFRNSLTGSWFIQELCKNFNAYGKRDDVVSLIIRATKCVCTNYFHNEDNVNKKQMPMFVSTLTKKFYLNRHKDRAILLEILESNDEIIKLLKNIKEKVDKIYPNQEKKKKESVKK